MGSVVLNTVIILVQGWSCFSPTFSVVDFFSFYVELPVMAVMYLGWKLAKRTKITGLMEMDLETDVYEVGKEDEMDAQREKSARGKIERVLRWIF